MSDCNWWEGREAIEDFVRRVETEFGERAARKIARALFETTGGLRIRIPTITDLERAERDQKIINLFTGDNIEELALRFGITRGAVYRVLNKSRRTS